MKGDTNKRFAVLFDLISEPKAIELEQAPVPVDPERFWVRAETPSPPYFTDDNGTNLEIDGSDLTIEGTTTSPNMTIYSENGAVIMEAPMVQVHNAQSVLRLPSPSEVILEGTAVALDGAGNAVACFGTFDYGIEQPIGICIGHDGVEATVVTQGTLRIEGAAYMPGQPLYIDDTGQLSNTPPSLSGHYVAQVGMALSFDMVLVNLPVTFITRVG